MVQRDTATPPNPISGGKLVSQSTKRRASGPECPVTRNRIRRTVNRTYDGVLSGGDVRERIIRAFLVEEQKIVKKKPSPKEFSYIV